MNNAEIGKAMVIKLDPVLLEYPTFKEGVRRAPKRELTLNKREIKLAVANALRYVPEELHEQLAPEFFDELLDKCQVVGTPGSGFGPAGEGYFRLTAFGNAEKTVEAVERIKAAYKK